ncbi:MAG TPA: dienelactone hydrolase family protein [Candidatus Eremiobacteraceae bacterium]|nr:dienelactone hydrolase family protein [Candidatus Eremiobacteraceae bacterium]
MEIPDLSGHESNIDVDGGSGRVAAMLTIPNSPRGLIVFAHGSGSGRHSARNQAVARELNDAGFATLLADLLTPSEDELDRRTFALRFDIELLASRILDIVRWASTEQATARLRIGYFGASTGAAAVLRAAAKKPDRIFAVVSRGGRPDLAGAAIASVQAPTLFIVGGADPIILELNRHCAKQMTAEVRLEVVPRATHLFEESGALEHAADLAKRWFIAHAGSRAS